MADENRFDADLPEGSQGDTGETGGSHIVEGLDSINTDEIIGDFPTSGEESIEELPIIDGEIEDDGEEIVVAPASEDENGDFSANDYDDEEEGDYPFWDEQYNTDFNDDSVYGDPDNVALTSEDDVFTNEDGIRSYAPGGSLLYGDTVPSGNDDDEESGFSPMFWVIIGLGTLLALALASWGALWANTGEANPVKAIQEGSEETTISQEESSSPIQTIEEEDPVATSEANRIAELESSLTVALDDAQSARDEAEQLKVAADAKPNDTITSTKTITKTGQNVTSTNTRTVTNTATTTRVVRSTDTMKVTQTSTVRMAPTTTTVTIPSTVKVPGPERTVTKTVPSGRVTVTTTVVERWG